MAWDRSHIARVAFTVGLIALVLTAITDSLSTLPFALVASVGVAVAIIHHLFPGSRMFSLALANLIVVYACLFAFFAGTNFRAVEEPFLTIGFLLPILAFLAGCWWQRERVRQVVRTRRVRSERRLAAAVAWLVPVFAIGAATFLLPELRLSTAGFDTIFILSMAAIATIVLFVSRDVAAFLVDTGLLFEEFFDRVRHMLVPTFAFLTFYSLQLIVFAAFYRTIDRFSAHQHFSIGGAQRDITFAEALYFSLVTVSTTGYGDILPLSDTVRVLAAVQIVTGILLLLFGFSEIMSYTRSRKDDAGKE